MIDNMLITRDIAVARKKEEKGGETGLNMTDIWFDEFLKLHPDYKSSKKNLWRKYKWYKSRMSQVEKDNQENMSDTESSKGWKISKRVFCSRSYCSQKRTQACPQNRP